jgi:threonyl-tRNA synthetase
MIHRAPFGSFERFVGILIEHFAGNFPLWLAPEQVRVLPISAQQAEYAEKICSDLKAAGVRASWDRTGDKIGAKIRNAEIAKVHTMFVIGQKEVDAESVAVRIHGKGDQGVKPVTEAISEIQASIAARSL